jgi:hypothetical protein
MAMPGGFGEDDRSRGVCMLQPNLKSFGLVAAVFLLGGLAPAAASSIDEIDLCWKPSLDLGDLTAGMAPPGDVAVVVRPFVDLRHRPEIVGEARLVARLPDTDGRSDDEAKFAEAASTPHVTTVDDVAEWVTRHFAEDLDEAGLEVGEGNIEIGGEIVQFFAVKAPDYNGDVQLRISVSRDGAVVWRGLVSGWARKADDDWDKGKGKHYCRILSDAMQRAVASLLWYPKFREAIGAAPLPPPAPPPAESLPAPPAGEAPPAIPSPDSGAPANPPAPGED